MGKHWRAPKKNNDAAWKRIAKGDYLWDKRAIISRMMSRGVNGFYYFYPQPVFRKRNKPGTQGYHVEDYKI